MAGEMSSRARMVPISAPEERFLINHFKRVFRRVHRKTPKAFALSMRIHHARKLLNCSDLSIKEITAATGYDTIYHCSGQFERFTGVSPTTYRNGNHSTRR